MEQKRKGLNSGVQLYRITTYLVILLIIIVSFISFSEKHFPYLNSDGALNILMTNELDMPQDLYCWGQDRGGSLIPVIGWGFHNLIGLDLVISVSLAHYLILILGFLAFASFLRNRFLVLILAFFWFLPPWHMLGFILYPFGLQYSLLGIAIYFLNRFMKESNGATRIAWLSLGLGTLIAMIWASDLGLVSILVAFGMILWYLLLKKKPRKDILGHTGLPEIVTALFWTAIGVSFIVYAKQTAVRIDVYNDNPFNNAGQVIESLGIFLASISEILLFRSKSPAEGVTGWLVIIAIIGALYYLVRKPGSLNRGYLVKFFLWNACTMILIIFLSHWVYQNGTGRRYFTAVYISAVLATLFLLNKKFSKEIIILPALLLLIALSGAVSSLLPFNYPDKKPSRIRVVSEFRSLGEAGIIAEYWNSYISASADPDNIKATPHENDNVRNWKLVEEVFDQPGLFLIRDLWLDTFPEKIEQFGYSLTRSGDEFFMGDSYLCEYERKKFKKFFTPDLLRYQGMLIPEDSTGSDSLVHIAPGYNRDKHIIYGPFIDLPRGRYNITFRMAIRDFPAGDNALAWLDVSENYGKGTIVSRNIYPGEVDTSLYLRDYTLPLVLDRRVEALEFRVLGMTDCNFYFSGINVVEE